jgi:tetratricopeptide (TPR) repeat protein
VAEVERPDAAVVSEPAITPLDLKRAQAERAMKEDLEFVQSMLERQDFVHAASRLQACSGPSNPARATCLRLLGSTYARLDARPGSSALSERARYAYRRFLDEAAANDPEVPEVRRLLASDAGEASLATPAAARSDAEAERLLDEARELARKKAYDAALVELERCAAWRGPMQATCYKVLGSTYAKTASRDQSDAEMAKARRAYERFLELAPPDDDQVPAVRKILEEVAMAPAHTPKNTLEQSDVMEVVLANKAAVANCAAEQHAKDPFVSGKLVMKWTIGTSGKTTAVTVVPPEFKNTPMAACVSRLIREWTFPPHLTQGEPVSFPFKF